jgi:hypothetical protein
VQRGRSSAGSERACAHLKGPPKPGEGFATVSDMIAAFIESNNTQTLSKISQGESCIKEVILHVGTPTLVTPLIDFLIQIECAKLWCLSDKSKPSFDFVDQVERPAMPLQFCTDPGILGQQASLNFVVKCRALAELLEEMLDSVAAPQSDATYCFLWDVQITVSTILLCC